VVSTACSKMLLSSGAERHLAITPCGLGERLRTVLRALAGTVASLRPRCNRDGDGSPRRDAGKAEPCGDGGIAELKHGEFAGECGARGKAEGDEVADLKAAGLEQAEEEVEADAKLCGCGCGCGRGRGYVWEIVARGGGEGSVQISELSRRGPVAGATGGGTVSSPMRRR
jgi:hypothetical protein